MIEESGNKRKTMAEKRQLFIEMRKSWVLPESLFTCVGVFFFSPDEVTEGLSYKLSNGKNEN